MENPELKALVYDNQSGAREIAQRSLQLLQRAATTSSATTTDELLDQLADLAVKVVRSKPEMPQVFHVLNRALRDAEARESAEEIGPFRIALLASLQEGVRGFQAGLDRLAEHAQVLVRNGDVVLTHSRSSTVLAALRRAKKEGKLFDVIVPESRPILEGRTLARELAEDQIPVRLMVDAMVASAVESADRVLIGADAITPDRLVNKAGTRAALIAAREAKVPVAVLAETHKAWTKKVDPALGLLTGRHRDPKEVWDNPPYGVEVVNLYFETAPLALAETVITEDGPLAPAAFWGHVHGQGYARRLAAAFQGELA